MTSFIAFIPYVQIVLSIILVITILMQKSDAGVGGSFGGNDNFNAGFHTRRGFEQKLFYFTIITATLFIILSILALILH